MISALERLSKPRGLKGTPGGRLVEIRELAGYPSRAAGSDALLLSGVEVREGKLGTYERDEISPQVDTLLDICDVFDGSPLYVLLGIGPRRWSELSNSAGVVAEPEAPYGTVNLDAAPEVHIPVRPEERRALELIARVRETTVRQLVRDLVDLPAVLAEEERIRRAIDRYESAVGEGEYANGD